MWPLGECNSVGFVGRKVRQLPAEFARGSFDSASRDKAAGGFAQDDKFVGRRGLGAGGKIFLGDVIARGRAGVYMLYAACAQSRYDRLRDG